MRRDGGGVEVLTFDYSVENHFNAIDTISELCGEPGAGVPLDEAEIQRLSPSITFLKEWRNYTYPPRDFRFSSEAESAPGEEGVACDLNLPQFSSAAVAEKEKLHGSTTSTRSSNDFVMYVGGPVWSLDWCPRSHEGPDTKVKSEFVAIAAHPPGSSYHKIGAPLVGRGIIQIWSVLNVHQNKEEEPSGIKQPNWTTKLVKSIEPKRPRGRPRKKPVDDCTEAKKPKGRPRKKSTNEPVNMITDGLNCDDQNALALVVEDPNSSCQQGRPRKKQVDESAQVKKPKGRSREKLIDEPMNRLTDDLNLDDQDVQPLSVAYPSISRQRGRSRKKHEDDCTDVKKPKIRPRSRKKSIDEPVNKQTGALKLDDQDVELLVIEYPSSSSQLLVKGKDSADTQGQRPQKQEVRRRKTLNRAEPACTPKDGSKSRLLKLKKIAWSKSDDSVCPSLLSQNGESSTPNHQMNEAEHTCTSNDGLQSGGLKRKRSTASKSDDSVGPLAISQNCKPSAQNHQINEKSRQDVVALDFVPDHVTSDISHPTRSIPKDVALPRVMLCLAHNGKVAWDVKWKPCTASSANCLHRMGFLAVLLGNGSLEVWDVPLPHIIKTIYSVSHGEGCDPRFVKLEPIFRCSVPQSGHAKSIPLTVEWSYSRPHDYILAGCHDGTVDLLLWHDGASRTQQ
ncbi:unnamed protein product [Linum tenue]|uniref:Transducin/WD40 repeat-like superfamily protein n=1 Tax=Linum tenue TaxID=586396 RepID=A0AAV0QXG0_9ROSI|nr:unnamed protein product [Linum tenue]